MSGIILNQFGGIRPIVDRSKLPPPHAQTAENCLFEGGNLRPVRAPKSLDISYPYQSSTTQSLFRLSDVQWLRWDGDVAAVQGPTPITGNYLSLGDDYRIYYAGDTGDAQQWPRWTTRYRAMGNTDPASFFDRPAFSYPLGVPKPQSVPTVSVSAAPSHAFGLLRKGNPVQAEGIEPTGLENAQRVLLTGLPTSGDGSELNNNQYSVSIVDAAKFKLDSADGSAWAGNVTGSFLWERVYADSELEDRIYVYTYVNEFGEESAPSSPSAMVSVGGGQYVTITMDTDPSVVVGSSPIFIVAKKRIYRSVAGSTELQFLFVAEVDIATVTYDDALDVSELGEVLSTDIYDLPPFDLQGLVVHPNGFLLGFVKNKLYASEPYLPYAWPADYAKTFKETIVGLQVYQSTVVILTTSFPYLAPCTDPASIDPHHAGQVYPCIDRRASVSTGYSVVYASPVGLISLDQAGPRNLTVDYFSAGQWSLRTGYAVGNAVSMQFLDNRIYLLTATDGMYVFDQRVQGRIDISTHPIVATALATNPADSALFVMFGSAGGGEDQRRLYEWNASGSELLVYTWESPRYILPHEKCFAWVQAFAQPYAGGARGLNVNVAHDVPVPPGNPVPADAVQTIPILSKAPKNLVSGFLADEWTVSVVGNVDLKAVHVTESIDEIKEISL